MKWLHIVGAVCGLYIVLSLGAWVVLRVGEGLLRRRLGLLATLENRVRVFRETHQEQSRAWPEHPRPGRYGEVDRQARQCLASLQTATDRFQQLRPTLAFYVPSELGLVDVFCLRSWGRLAETVAVWRALRAAEQLVSEGEVALTGLWEQALVVEDIPHAVRQKANAVGVQLGDLEEALCAEQEAGTLGLEMIALQLPQIGARSAASLAALDRVDPSQMPRVISEVDQALNACLSDLDGVGGWLWEAKEQRSKAQSLLNRVNKDLHLAGDRWKRLRAAGAKELAVTQSLPSLQTKVRQLTESYQERTLAAYGRVNTEGPSIEAEIRSLAGLLDRLEAVMLRSQQAIEGLGQALVESQTAHEDLQ